MDSQLLEELEITLPEETTTIHALVIDNDPQARELLTHTLRNIGWHITEADSAETAFELLPDQEWSVVFSEVILNGADGYSVLKRFKEELPQTKVVLMTSHANATDALDSTAFGAHDYLLKPFGVETLQTLCAGLAQQLATPPQPRLRIGKRAGFYKSDIDLVGRSGVFIEVMKQVGRVAATNLPVFLTGESGTGKELVASALHQRSTRAQKPFVAVNCGAIPSELIESELFGHMRGSFTGAERDRRGLWEEADGGTIFLDEITETTTAFQVKLLRALQEGEIRRVGSNQTQKLDVRVIAASNRDVEAEVKAARFRQDLFYRLNAVSIVMPPLRDRREDVLPLTRYFSKRVRPLRTSVLFSPEALTLLKNYSWPGNIRELENAIVRASAMCDGTIRTQDLPEKIRNHSEPFDALQTPLNTSNGQQQQEAVPLAEMQARYVTWVLQYAHGNKQAACRILEVDRKTLNRMIKRHCIEASPPTTYSRAATWTN